MIGKNGILNPSKELNFVLFRMWSYSFVFKHSATHKKTKSPDSISRQGMKEREVKKQKTINSQVPLLKDAYR